MNAQRGTVDFCEWLNHPFFLDLPNLTLRMKARGVPLVRVIVVDGRSRRIYEAEAPVDDDLFDSWYCLVRYGGYMPRMTLEQAHDPDLDFDQFCGASKWPRFRLVDGDVVVRGMCVLSSHVHPKLPVKIDTPLTVAEARELVEWLDPPLKQHPAAPFGDGVVPHGTRTH